MAKPTTLADIIDLAAEAGAKRRDDEAKLHGEPLTPEEKQAMIDRLRAQFAQRFREGRR